MSGTLGLYIAPMVHAAQVLLNIGVAEGTNYVIALSKTKSYVAKFPGGLLNTLLEVHPANLKDMASSKPVFLIPGKKRPKSKPCILSL